MVKFLGNPLEIPAATAGTQAARKQYVDTGDAALSARISTLEAGGGGTGSARLTAVEVTGDYTANPNEYVLVYPTHLTNTITLPTSPADGTIVGVKKVDNNSTIYPIYVAAPSGVLIDTSSVPYPLTTYPQGAEFMYLAGTWYIITTSGDMRWRGAYSSNSADYYYPGDVVTSGGTAYIVTGASVVSGGSAPPPGAPFLALSAAGGSGSTVTVGTTTTGASGTNASVTNSGTSSAAVLNFTIPQGPKGDTGASGTTGPAGTGFTYRGTWSSSATYAVNDVVTYLGTTYVTVVAGTTGSANVPTTSKTTPFKAMAEGMHYYGSWASGQVYNPGDVVSYNGSFYINTAQSTAGQSPLVGNFDAMAVGFNYRGTWVSGTTYQPRDIVYYQGSTYLVGTTTSTTSAPDPAFTTPFTLFSQGIRSRGVYAAGTAYVPGDIVSFSNGSYVNLTASTGTAPTAGSSTATWLLLAAQGATGTAGTAATIAVGTTTTGAAGSSATVTNSGTSGAAVLNFTIPQGAAGTTGTAGTAATVAVGTTTTGAAGSSATVTNSGTSSAAVLNFTVPQGAAGTTGTAGANGTAATVAVGTTTTGAAGSNAAVTNSGTSSAAVLNFTVPQGATGSTGTAGTAATVAVGTTTTGASGTNAAVTNSGTSSAAVLNFTVPQGPTGPAGPGGGGLTPTASKTAAYTAVKGDLVLANASTAGFTVTLPASPALGDTVGVKKTDTSANTVTVVGSGSTTIDGDPSALLASQDAAATFVFDGGNWQVASTAILNIASAASTVASPSSGFVPWGNGRIMLKPVTNSYLGAVSIATGITYFMPIRIPNACTVSSLAVYATTSSSSTVTLSMYAEAFTFPSGGPGLRLATGSFSYANSSGVASVAVNYTFTAATTIWAAFSHTAATSIISAAPAALVGNFVLGANMTFLAAGNNVRALAGGAHPADMTSTNASPTAITEPTIMFQTT